MYVREQVKRDLTEVIVGECTRLGISPGDSTRVMMHSQDIWQALVRSGKMPRILTYEMFIDGMTRAAMTNQFNDIFGRRK